MISISKKELENELVLALRLKYEYWAKGIKEPKPELKRLYLEMSNYYRDKVEKIKKGLRK